MKIRRIRIKNMLLPFLLAAGFAEGFRLSGQAVSAEIPSPEKHSPGVIVMLKYSDAERSPYYRSRRLAERFLTIARDAVRAGKRSWKIHLSVSPETDPEQFSVTPLRMKREIRIVVPRDFNLWCGDRKMHISLMALMIQARLGDDFLSGKPGKGGKEGAPEILQNHWIVRGLAKKAVEDPLFGFSPFFRFFPGARALSAAGFFPSVKEVIRVSPLPEFESPASLLESEYAELLLDACAATGFFRENCAETLLCLALTAPGEDQYGAFLKLVSGVLNKPVPLHPSAGKCESVSGAVFPGADCDIWFHKFLSRTLLHYFSPVDVESFEELFRKASCYEFTDKNGVHRSCTLAEFPAVREFLPDENAAADELITRLNLLSFTAPAGFHVPLSELRLALARCRTDRSEEAALALRDMEKRLYRLISERVSLEWTLLRREWKYAAPAFRLRRTLPAVRALQKYGVALPSGIRKSLDRRDEYR